MKQIIKDSELIINPDGSVYHLNLKPENIGEVIILVGDPDRVSKVSAHFDEVIFQTQKREFVTHTGIKNGKKISVISSGIGPDNIDIVINELDALVNIDLKTRLVKDTLTSLKLIRIGTSGAIQPEIPVDRFVLSTHGIGTDNMLRSYRCDVVTETELENAFIDQTAWDLKKGRPYIVSGDKALKELLYSDEVYYGMTLTCGGFYGAQGRKLRIELQDENLNSAIENFQYDDFRISNIEMETAAIYGLSKLLGHQAISMNAIVANRVNKKFSSNPYQPVENLITYVLNRITE